MYGSYEREEKLLKGFICIDRRNRCNSLFDSGKCQRELSGIGEQCERKAM